MVGMEEQPAVREIDSVEGLRARADPVRLAILSVLDTHVPDGWLSSRWWCRWLRRRSR